MTDHYPNLDYSQISQLSFIAYKKESLSSSKALKKQ